MHTSEFAVPTPKELGAGGDMALDGDEEWAYFRVGVQEAAKHLAPGTKLEKNFGPRNMGQGPSGIAGMNIKTGEIKACNICSIPGWAYTNQSMGRR
jgi:oligogalacturonide lyase